jgi:hypothetical protein
MFSAFAGSLSTELTTAIPAALGALTVLIGGIAGLGWGMHFLRKFGIFKKA